MEHNTNTQKIGKYIFIDGILQPQTIAKGILTYFYGCAHNTLRAILLRKGITDPDDHSKTYTKSETEQIFAELGPVYYDDAREYYTKYLLYKQKKQKHNQKRAKSQKKSPKIHKFSI